MELKKAKKAVKILQKVKARLYAGKKMTTEERRKVTIAIDNASAQQCPFEKHFTLCKVKDCLFCHQTKKHPAKKYCKKYFRGGEEVSAANVVE